MKRKISLSCYAICMLLMSVILMWRASSGYVFAYEYNSMNGKENADGETYMNLSVDTDNPFIVSTDSDIIAAIDEGYTGYIYFGYPTCPYCRNTVPVLVDEFKENKIRRVLYCNLKNTTTNTSMIRMWVLLRLSTVLNRTICYLIFCMNTQAQRL